MKLEEQKQETERQLKALTKQMKVRFRFQGKAKLSFYYIADLGRDVVILLELHEVLPTSFDSASSVHF